MAQVPSEAGAGRSVKCMAVKMPYRGSGGYVGEHQQQQQQRQECSPVTTCCCKQGLQAWARGSLSAQYLFPGVQPWLRCRWAIGVLTRRRAASGAWS